MLFCLLLTLITYLFLNINFRLSRACMRIFVNKATKLGKKSIKNTLMPIIFFNKNTSNW